MVNHSLKDLCLTDTGLTTEAVIAIAESLAENKSLGRLDLSKNPLIDIAGMMAIAVSIRLNHSITFIDINITVTIQNIISNEFFIYFIKDKRRRDVANTS